MASIEVLQAGLFSTVQDRGRPGFSAVGLGRSGVADRASAALANRMLGNGADAAMIETTFGGLEVQCFGALQLVITGAACEVSVTRQTADGPRSHGAAVLEIIGLGDGDVIRLGRPTRGLRNYLAIRGGIETQRVLGSRSWDSLAQLGTPPLRTGTRLPIGRTAPSWPVVDAVAPALIDDAPTVLEALPGPRTEWFTAAAISLFESQLYTVGQDSNRVGMRLTADVPLERRITGELPSEGVELGSLQVPPEGFPVIFLADHPVTGGYPVVAVLRRRSIDLAAQLPPGAQLRFRLSS